MGTTNDIKQVNLKSKMKYIKVPIWVSPPDLKNYVSDMLSYIKQRREFNKEVKECINREVNMITGRDKFQLSIKNNGTKKYKAEDMKEQDRQIRVGDRYIRTYYLADLPPFLNSYVLFNLINSSIPLKISIFIKSTVNGALIKKARERLSVLEMQQNDRLKKGKVVDQRIEKSIDEISTFINELVYEVEKGFLFSFYVGIEAESKKALLELHKSFQNLVDSMEFTFNTYTFEQRKGFLSLLPFNKDEVKETRILQTSAVSYLVPFLSKQLNDPKGIFLGFNAYNKSLVLIDLFKARNSNINIFGTSGSGKTVAAKLAALRLFMNGVQVLVIDPEGEYAQLAKSIGGEVIEFSREHGINPFYIGSTREEDILNHISVLKTFFKFFVPPEKYDMAILDKKLVELYKKKVPSYQDLLKLMKGNQMYEYLAVLEKGSLKGVFNSDRQLDLDNNFIVFDISELNEEEKRAPAMYLLTSLIWNLVNKKQDRRRMLFIDEAHNLLVDKNIAVFYKDIVKRARKRNLGVVSITQNVEDFIKNEYGAGILTNAETTILLKQAYATLTMLQDIYPITDEEREHLGSLSVGESILFREQEHVRLNVYPLSTEFDLIQGKK